MSTEIDYTNNPLHGTSLKKMLTEIVDHYGFELLFAYLNINCFKNNPSIASSVKFLKKTDWAREKVESFYLYEFKSLPRASSEQFILSPRDRIIPEEQSPGEPKELSLEDAAQLREKREQRQAERDQEKEGRSGKVYGANRSKKTDDGDNMYQRKDERKPEKSKSSPADGKVDPWAKWKDKS